MIGRYDHSVKNSFGWFRGVLLLLLAHLLFVPAVQAQLGGVHIGQSVAEAIVSLEKLGSTICAVDTTTMPGIGEVLADRGVLRYAINHAVLDFHNGELCEARFGLHNGYRKGYFNQYDSMMTEELGGPLDRREVTAVRDSLMNIPGMDMYRGLLDEESGEAIRLRRVVAEGGPVLVLLVDYSYSIGVYLFSPSRLVARNNVIHHQGYDHPLLLRLLGPATGYSRHEAIAVMTRIGSPDPGSDTARRIAIRVHSPERVRSMGDPHPLSGGYQLWFDENDEVAVVASTLAASCRSVVAMLDERYGGRLGRKEAGDAEQVREVLEAISAIAPELHPDAPLPRNYREFGMWRVPNVAEEEYIILHQGYREITLWHFTRNNLRRMDQ